MVALPEVFDPRTYSGGSGARASAIKQRPPKRVGNDNQAPPAVLQHAADGNQLGSGNRLQAEAADPAEAERFGARVAKIPTGLVWERHGEPSPFPEPFWLIKGFVPTEGNCLLAGVSTAGKTFVAMSLAVALATGAPFMGLPIRQMVGAAVIIGEGRSTIRKRLAAAVIGASRLGYDTRADSSQVAS